MSFTDQPEGKRPRCEVCGEHRWTHDGYCLSVTCAGPPGPGWPHSRPNVDAEDTTKMNLVSEAKPRKPRKGTVRSTILYYESLGQTPPWLEKERYD